MEFFCNNKKPLQNFIFPLNSSLYNGNDQIWKYTHILFIKNRKQPKNRKVQSIASEINKTNQVPQQILRENEKQILLKTENMK